MCTLRKTFITIFRNNLMVRHFTSKTKLSIHNKSYAIHPSKIIIGAMGWKKGQIISLVPIPERGLICFKGPKQKKKIFEKKFYENLIFTNKKKYFKILNKLISLRDKLGPLELISYEKDIRGLNILIKSLEIYLSKSNKNISNINIKISKAISRYKNKGPIFLGQKIEKIEKEKFREIKKASS